MELHLFWWSSDYGQNTKAAQTATWWTDGRPGGESRGVDPECGHSIKKQWQGTAKEWTPKMPLCLSAGLPACLSFCLSSTPGRLWISTLTRAPAFSSSEKRKKKKERLTGEKFTQACSYNVTLTGKWIAEDRKKWQWTHPGWFSGSKGNIIRSGTDYGTRKPIWMWRLKVTGFVLTVGLSLCWLELLQALHLNERFLRETC